MERGDEHSSVILSMEEIQTSFAKTLTLTAEEAKGIFFEEEEDEANDAALAMSLVVRVYTEKPVHRRAFTDRILELWQPVKSKRLVEDFFSSRSPSSMITRKLWSLLPRFMIKLLFFWRSLMGIWLHRSCNLSTSIYGCHAKSGAIMEGVLGQPHSSFGCGSKPFSCCYL